MSFSGYLPTATGGRGGGEGEADPQETRMCEIVMVVAGHIKGRREGKRVECMVIVGVKGHRHSSLALALRWDGNGLQSF